MPTTTLSDKTNTLTNRRYDVLVLWAKEFTKKQIAAKFYLSLAWADKELRIIYKKLGVHTRHGAVDKAWLLGIFTLEIRK
ncbi:MAG: LuxR C-terminal-related transcriptional regulator [Bacteroidia bacterium]